MLLDGLMVLALLAGSLLANGGHALPPSIWLLAGLLVPLPPAVLPVGPDR